MQKESKENLSTRLASALGLIDEAIKDASERISHAPDNPAVQRLESSGRAFIVNSSEVFSRSQWDAFAHDWIAQYTFAGVLLETRRFAALTRLLSGEGYWSSTHGWRSFAKEVIENIKQITGDLRVAVAQTDATLMERELGQDARGSALRVPVKNRLRAG